MNKHTKRLEIGPAHSRLISECLNLWVDQLRKSHAKDSVMVCCWVEAASINLQSKWSERFTRRLRWDHKISLDEDILLSSPFILVKPWGKDLNEFLETAEHHFDWLRLVFGQQPALESRLGKVYIDGNEGLWQEEAQKQVAGSSIEIYVFDDNYLIAISDDEALLANLSDSCVDILDKPAPRDGWSISETS